MKTKTFSVTVDFQGLTDITNGDIERMLDYFMAYSIWADNYDIYNIKVSTVIDTQEV